jgi:hypothetical protein
MRFALITEIFFRYIPVTTTPLDRQETKMMIVEVKTDKNNEKKFLRTSRRFVTIQMEVMESFIIPAAELRSERSPETLSASTAI